MSNSFENFIMQCCKSPEHQLRHWIKKVLKRRGFKIYEDDYVSDRAKTNKIYERVHNLLAIRGENPKVCLVAHTDVCRDHGFKNNRDFGYEWRNSDNPNKESESNKSNLELNIPQPTIKVAELTNGTFRRVIQDKDGKTQVGGDDRLGVAINLWIALNTGYDMGLLFTTDEEIGLKGARHVKFDQLKDFELLVQVDRGNHSNELVTKISSEYICDTEPSLKLLEIAYDIGMPRRPVNGGHTDVYAIKLNKMCKNAVNMTCGYHNSYSDGGEEFIDIEESRDTMKYVSEIIKHYYLNG